MKRRAGFALRGTGARRRAAARLLPVLLATAATGVAAGLGAVALTLLLHLVQHVAFGYTEDTFLTGVEEAGAARRVLAVGIGGLVVGLGWWLHRRAVPEGVSVTRALTLPVPWLSLPASVSDAVLQIVAVGAGASLGREGAPRQVGAALGGLIAERLRLTPEQRATLLACGAGAGLAAAYNVPLGGAVFTLEVLLASTRLSTAVYALTTAGIATVVSWPFLGDGPAYQLPATAMSASAVAAALVLGAACGTAGLVFRAIMARARAHVPHGWLVAAAMPATFTALGALAIAYPQLLGNGKSLAEVAFTTALPVGLAAALGALKPLVTAACLGSGAVGGLLTPAFSSGAVLGVLAAHAWATAWPGADPTVLALAGAAGLLAITQRATLTAVVLAMEFTHAPLILLVPLALAVTAAQLSERGLRAARRRLVRDDVASQPVP